MSMSEDSKQKAWLEHYQRLLNVEFDWHPDHLSYQPQVEGPPIPITIDMVKKAKWRLAKHRAGKSRLAKLSGIVVKMIWAAGDMCASMIRDLVMARRTHWKGATTAVSSWQSRLWKSWRGLWMASSDSWCQSTIPSFVLSQAERGTTDAIFVVRQLQEKYLAANKRLHGFRRPGEGVWSSTSEGHLVGAEKTWVWRSGLCYWCRECMQMHGAVSVLVRGTVKSLKWRMVFTKDQYSACCSSSLCLKPYHESSALGFPGKTCMLMTLLSSLNRLRNVLGGSWHGKKQWRRKDWE